MAEPTYRYRALEPIAVDGVRAYNIGDWVPDENVELHDYEVGVQVERVEIPAVEDEDEADPAQPPAPAVVPQTPPVEAAPPAEKLPVKKPRPTPSA
jgi:hypothetical protein